MRGDDAVLCHLEGSLTLMDGRTVRGYIECAELNSASDAPTAVMIAVESGERTAGVDRAQITTTKLRVSISVVINNS